MEDLVARGEADFALTYIPVPRPELDHLRVQEVQMGIFGITKKFDDFSENETPFIVPSFPIEGSPNKVRGLDGWPDDLADVALALRVELADAGPTDAEVREAAYRVELPMLERRAAQMRVSGDEKGRLEALDLARRVRAALREER